MSSPKINLRHLKPLPRRIRARSKGMRLSWPISTSMLTFTIQGDDPHPFATPTPSQGQVVPPDPRTTSALYVGDITAAVWIGIDTFEPSATFDLLPFPALLVEGQSPEQSEEPGNGALQEDDTRPFDTPAPSQGRVAPPDAPTHNL